MWGGGNSNNMYIPSTAQMGSDDGLRVVTFLPNNHPGARAQYIANLRDLISPSPYTRNYNLNSYAATSHTRFNR